MIVRKYTDGETNLEVNITEEKKVMFGLELEGDWRVISLSYEDVEDLRNQLYDFARKIEPPKPAKSNG